MADYNFKDDDCYCHKCNADYDSLDVDVDYEGDNIITSIVCNDCGYTRVVESSSIKDVEQEMLDDLKESEL